MKKSKNGTRKMRERVKRGECYKMRARKKRKLIMGRSLNHRNKSLISMVEKWIGGKEMGPGYILNTWKAFSLKGSREMWGTYELAQFFIWKIWVGLENARKGTNRRGDKTNEAMSWFLKKNKTKTPDANRIKNSRIDQSGMEGLLFIVAWRREYW